MLQPKKTKYKNVQKGRNRGIASRAAKLQCGTLGLKALENGVITSKQIETLRVLISKSIDKKFGTVSIIRFPTKPITKKPLSTRMGSGKGNFVTFGAPVKAGHILFVIRGVDKDKIKKIEKEANSKLPFKIIAVEPKNLLY